MNHAEICEKIMSARANIDTLVRVDGFVGGYVQIASRGNSFYVYWRVDGEPRETLFALSGRIGVDVIAWAIERCRSPGPQPDTRNPGLIRALAGSDQHIPGTYDKLVAFMSSFDDAPPPRPVEFGIAKQLIGRAVFGWTMRQARYAAAIPGIYERRMKEESNG